MCRIGVPAALYQLTAELEQWFFVFLMGEGGPWCLGAQHKRIESGISKQLPAYLKVNRISSGFFIIMWFRDKTGKYFNEPTKYTKEQMGNFIKAKSKKLIVNYI